MPCSQAAVAGKACGTTCAVAGWVCAYMHRSVSCRRHPLQDRRRDGRATHHQAVARRLAAAPFPSQACRVCPTSTSFQQRAVWKCLSAAVSSARKHRAPIGKPLSPFGHVDSLAFLGLGGVLVGNCLAARCKLGDQRPKQLPARRPTPTNLGLHPLRQVPEKT